mmetsp:Transcript_401/g.414  ORF Transcript_401/g.414 Transcript_401/m.414 type:complete len:574 (+) Transcript_401:74-1795(+)
MEVIIRKPLSRMSTMFAVGAAVFLVMVTRWRLKGERIRRRKRKKDRSVNIGAVFGMDVGGTLAKIVFFEKNMNTESAKLSNDSKLQTSNDDSSSSDSDSSNEHINCLDNNICHKKSNSDSNLNSNGNSNGCVPMRRNSRSLEHLDEPDHQMALQQLYAYMEHPSSHKRRERSGMFRDDTLAFYSSSLGGWIHFLRFETRNMISMMDFISSTSITENIHTIGCTGGGAHKYAKEFSERLDITLQSTDEMSSLIRGMHFALTQSSEECYTYRHIGAGSSDILGNRPARSPLSPSLPSPHPTHEPCDSTNSNGSTIGSNSSRTNGHGQGKEKDKSLWNQDVKEYMKKVILNDIDTTQQFPYLVVNIGSGVSILKVTGPGAFERVSGSSLGGGTYWGLCRLLTRCASYEEVLSKAESGDNTEIDMLVKDIYGGDYENMNLSGTMVASSFGKFVMKDTPKEGLKEEDIAISLLMMITNNIGQVSYLNAKLHGCSKIFFVGSFLRHNSISCRRLAFAIHFWSKGEMEALFLHHEGYFGALGTFLQCAYGANVDNILATKSSKTSYNNKEKSNGADENGG